MGCWAHARRNFVEALNLDRARALIGIGFISKLYDADRDARHANRTVDGDTRNAFANPLLASLRQWVKAERSLLTAPSTIERAPASCQQTREQPKTPELLKQRQLMGRGAQHQQQDAVGRPSGPNGVQ